MKRVGNLHTRICSLENIELADKKARKDKKSRWGIVKHDKWKDKENAKLKNDLEKLTYKTSEYSTFKIYEPKERVIFRLPYYPDRIAHHAIMNIMEPIWTKIFIKNTYSCIKGRGIHKLHKDLSKDLRKYPNETVYCLKMDIKKFYPSIDHEILESILKKKIKDKKLMAILHEIIHSAKGVPIGNYLSQFFANLYLAYFDHWLKEEVGLKFYYRYADDIVILHSDKNFLRNVLVAIKLYLKHVLKLELKSNYQVFPVESRGIDFVGYKFYHTHTLLRKSIKQRLNRQVNKYLLNKISLDKFRDSMRAYFGWTKYCNSKNLLRKIQSKTGLKFSNFNETVSNITKFYNKKVYILEVINYSKYFSIHFIYNGKPYIVNSKDQELFLSIHRYNKFPLIFKISPYVRSNKNNIRTRA